MFWIAGIVALASKLGLRQIVLATAMVFVRRFYRKNDIRSTNPYVMLATAVYVASKIEECPVHIKVLVSEARSLWPQYIQPEISKVGECEFRLISDLNALLIVHHPYRTLARLSEQFQMTTEDTTTAWKVINDQYVTDLPLRYPPHVNATAAIVLTLTVEPDDQAVRPGSAMGNGIISSVATRSADADPSRRSTASQASCERLQEWLGQNSVDLEQVMEGVQQMLSLYRLLEQDRHADGMCKDLIARFVREQRLESWAGDM